MQESMESISKANETVSMNVDLSGLEEMEEIISAGSGGAVLFCCCC